MCGIDRRGDGHRGTTDDHDDCDHHGGHSSSTLRGALGRRGFLRQAAGATGAAALLGGAGTAAGYHTQNPAADRFVAADSSNYTSDSRGAAEIDWIVVHCTVGSYSSAINWFQDPSADVSAHYVVSNYDHTSGPPGEVTQMVHNEDQAWHASATNGPSIGIEHEWHSDYGRYFTDACYQASAAVVRNLADEFDIPLEYYRDPTCVFDQPGGILGHRDAPDSGCGDYPAKSCPGPDWDADTFMSYVEDGSGGVGGGGGGTDPKFAMDDGAMATVDLNGREGPGLNYDVVETLPEGAVGQIVNGPETNDGYTWWGLHFHEQDVWVWCVEQYLQQVAFYDGESVHTTVDLNGRTGPGLNYDVVDTYPTGTEAEVVNGPEANDGYTWWGLHVPAYGDWVWCVERYLDSSE